MKKWRIVFALFSAYVAFYAIAVALHRFEAVSHGSAAETRWLGYKEYRGILHVHSELSRDSKGSFADLRSAAERRDIDFIVTTDHWSRTLYDRSRRGMYGSTLFIAGTELNKSDGVTLLAVPLPRDFIPKPDWQENVHALRKEGSLVLGAHIEFSAREPLAGLDGLEIWNTHAESIEGSRAHIISSYAHLAWPLNLDLAFLVKDVDGAKRWRDAETLKRGIIPSFAGDDNHENYPFIGYERTFLLSSTHVWAKDLTEASVLDAIRNGRGYVAFEVFGRAEGFRAYVVSSQGVFLPGSTAPLVREGSVFTAEVPDCHNCRIEVFLNGRAWHSANANTARFEISETGIYSTMVYRNDHPWIISNSIAVR